MEGSILFWDKLLVLGGKKKGGTQLNKMEHWKSEAINSPSALPPPAAVWEELGLGSVDLRRARLWKGPQERGMQLKQNQTCMGRTTHSTQISALAWNSFLVITCVCEEQRKQRMENEGYRKVH